MSIAHSQAFKRDFLWKSETLTAIEIEEYDTEPNVHSFKMCRTRCRSEGNAILNENIRLEAIRSELVDSQSSGISAEEYLSATSLIGSQDSLTQMENNAQAATTKIKDNNSATSKDSYPSMTANVSDERQVQEVLTRAIVPKQNRAVTGKVLPSMQSIAKTTIGQVEPGEINANIQYNDNTLALPHQQQLAQIKLSAVQNQTVNATVLKKDMIKDVCLVSGCELLVGELVEFKTKQSLSQTIYNRNSLTSVTTTMTIALSLVTGPRMMTTFSTADHLSTQRSFIGSTIPTQVKYVVSDTLFPGQHE